MLKKSILCTLFVFKCFAEPINVPFVSMNVYTIKTSEIKGLTLNQSHLSYKEYQTFFQALMKLHPNLIFACPISTIDTVSMPCNFIETITVPKVTKNTNAPDSITPIFVNFNKTVIVKKIIKNDNFYHANVALDFTFPVGLPKINIGQDSFKINEAQQIDITSGSPYNAFITRYDDTALQNASQKEYSSPLNGYTIVYTYGVN